MASPLPPLAVCIKNLIRFDCVAESHNVSEIIGHGKQRFNDEIERRSGTTVEELVDRTSRQGDGHAVY